MFDTKFALGFIMGAACALLLSAIAVIGLMSNPVVVEIGQPTPKLGYGQVGDAPKVWYLEVPVKYYAADSLAVKSVITSLVQRWQSTNSQYRVNGAAPLIEFRTVNPDTVGTIYFQLDAV